MLITTKYKMIMRGFEKKIAVFEIGGFLRLNDIIPYFLGDSGEASKYIIPMSEAFTAINRLLDLIMKG